MASDIKDSSMNAHNLKVLAASCQVNDILKRISPRWKMQILYSISKGLKQFSLLKRAFPSLSDQILGRRLAELVEEGLIEKKILLDTVPTQITYSITPIAIKLLDIISDLHQWGQESRVEQ